MITLLVLFILTHQVRLRRNVLEISHLIGIGEGLSFRGGPGTILFLGIVEGLCGNYPLDCLRGGRSFHFESGMLAWKSLVDCLLGSHHLDCLTQADFVHKELSWSRSVADLMSWSHWIDSNERLMIVFFLTKMMLSRGHLSGLIYVEIKWIWGCKGTWSSPEELGVVSMTGEESIKLGEIISFEVRIDYLVVLRLYVQIGRLYWGSVF